MENHQVTATCVVHTALSATVTWKVDGILQSPDKVTNSENKTPITSTLTISSNQWKQARDVKCEVQHRCFANVETHINVSGKRGQDKSRHVENEGVKRIINNLLCRDPPGTTLKTPSISIRRSLSEYLNGKFDILECEVTGFDPVDLYITIGANGVELNHKEYVDLSKGPQLRSIIRQFEIPPTYRQKNVRFTCNVHQGFSPSFSSPDINNIYG